jgi:hypothetical protein
MHIRHLAAVVRSGAVSLATIWMVVTLATSLSAQQSAAPAPEPGFQRDRAYLGPIPFEHIDTSSGNLLLTFDDFALPGYNGMDLVFQRTFNSANQGWTFGLAGFPMRVRRVDGPGRPPKRSTRLL